MAAKYTAKQGERLDTIVYSYYGTVDVLHTVMLYNVDLLGKELLDDGDVVTLPVIDTESSEIEKGKTLWQ